MTDSDYYVRIQALTQLLNELRAKLAALEARLAAAEQNLSGKWMQ